ncbi:hypothetical protein ACROYT_G027471 [Oculina patagonica]
MRLMRFHFKEIKHVPGKKMHFPDALSRLQVRSQAVQSTTDDDEMYAHIGSVSSSLPASDTRLQQIMEAQEVPVCRQIKVYCHERWPDKLSFNDAMKPYWPRKNCQWYRTFFLKHLGSWPSSMRLEILDKIHEGHQGITKCCERAKSSVWWPGLSREIQDLVQKCIVCALYRDTKPERTAYHHTLTRPSMASRGHIPLPSERHRQPYFYRLLLKLRRSSSHAEEDKVKVVTGSLAVAIIVIDSSAKRNRSVDNS